MKTLYPFVVIAFFSGTTIACGGTGTSTEQEPSEVASHQAGADEVSAQASSASQKDLGVVSWVAGGEATASYVRGYNASDAVVVELTHTTTVKSDALATHRFVLRRPNGTSAMELSVERHEGGGGILTMLENAFAKDPGASDAIERIQADFEASGQDGTSLTAESFSGGLKLQDDIAKDQCNDLVKCGQSKLTRLDADAKSALICGGSAILVGAGVAFDSATGQDPAEGAKNRAGACAQAVDFSKQKAAESAEACRINCVQL